MILLLARGNDPVANAVQQELPGCVRLSADDLVFAPHWVHRIDENGNASTEIGLADGLFIRSENVHGLFNRLRYLEAIHFLNETDRMYADMELNALFQSFLQSMSNAMLHPFNLMEMQTELTNELLVKTAAMALGIPVTDLELSSAPRWRSSRHLIAFETHRRSPDAFYKKAPHLIWENKPLRQQAKTGKMFRAFISGSKVTSEIEIPFGRELLELASGLGSAYMELRIAACADGLLRLHETDIHSRTVNLGAIKALAAALQHKALQTV